MPSANGVSWGLAELDRVIGTAWPGRLIVIGARPSNGKTTWLFSWVNSLYAEIASARHRVLCYWTERSVDLAYRTWAALRYGWPLDAAVKGDWGDLPAGAEAALGTEERLLRYWDRGQATGSEGWVAFAPGERPTVAELVRTAEASAPTILVLDYLQRIKPDGRQTKFEAVAEAATALQQLAVRRGIIVVVGSQLKRRGDGVLDKYLPPHLEDFKLSGEIEENADVALGLYRPTLRMTGKDVGDVKAGDRDITTWAIPHTMAIKVLKHRYWGEAADRTIRVRCQDGQVRDLVEAPAAAGDAWEEPF